MLTTGLFSYSAIELTLYSAQWLRRERNKILHQLFIYTMVNQSYRHLASLFCLLALALHTSAQAANEEAKTILVFGDSLTAGYGIDYDQAYPTVLQTLLLKENLNYEVIPSGVSGETTAGGLRRIDWVMRRPIDIFILALGGNDGLRGIPVADTKQNLIAIIERVRTKNPDTTIVIAGMLMPPNLGTVYTEAFAGVYPEVASEADTLLISFLLEGVAGEPDLNLADGIHPNPQGHQIVAQHVFDSLHASLIKDEAGARN